MNYSGGDPINYTNETTWPTLSIQWEELDTTSDTHVTHATRKENKKQARMMRKLNYYWATVYPLRSYSISTAMHLCRGAANAFDYALHILYHPFIKGKRLGNFTRARARQGGCQTAVGIRRKAPAKYTEQNAKMAGVERVTRCRG